jgi:hypothetical protein
MKFSSRADICRRENELHGEHMRHNFRLLAAVFSTAITLSACDSSHSPTDAGHGGSSAIDSTAFFDRTLTTRNDVQIVRGTGDIAAVVQQFRDLLGGGAPNPNTAGEFQTGRREINWDGVPATFTNNDLFPGNFFNVNSPRGAVFTTDGFGFRISNNGFVDLNPSYAGEFNTFSPPKLFVARGSTTINVQFFVAGSNTPAAVTGFGSVFEDVGRAHSTTIQFFDANGTELLKIAAPRASDERGLSFLGAQFDSPIVASVRITAGDTPLSETSFDNVKGAGKKFDLVATDDFIYGEPHKIK